MRRLADPTTASRHWGSVTTVTAWGQFESRPCLSVLLTNLSAGDLLVPSFASLETSSQPQIQAEVIEETLVLPAMPGESDTPLAPERSFARASIDCLEILRDIPALRLRFSWPGSQPPQHFLAAVSIRPEHLPESLTPSTTVASVGCARFSQMTLPADVAQRCCSPVSLGMTLLSSNPELDVAALVAECRHPASGLYGVWPMATAAAARRGKLMSVEACSSIDPVLRALAVGTPVIASIRFKAGELTDAPLNSTAGHLIVVRGIEDGQVIAHDPAAPDHESVLRRYALDEFSRAWLTQRGVVYFYSDAADALADGTP